MLHDVDKHEDWLILYTVTPYETRPRCWGGWKAREVKHQAKSYHVAGKPNHRGDTQAVYFARVERVYVLAPSEAALKACLAHPLRPRSPRAPWQPPSRTPPASSNWSPPSPCPPSDIERLTDALGGARQTS